MHINLEANEQYAIQGYSELEVKIDYIVYQHNIIVSKQGVITNWELASIQQLNETTMRPLLTSHPKIIIIGHPSLGKFVHPSLLQTLSQQQISLEAMSIGAACRTFNILLSEQREVTLGLIFSQ